MIKKKSAISDLNVSVTIKLAQKPNTQYDTFRSIRFSLLPRFIPFFAQVPIEWDNNVIVNKVCDESE